MSTMEWGPPPALEGAPALTQNSMTVLKRRYLKKWPEGAQSGVAGRPGLKPEDYDHESPEAMFWRVACNIAEAETKYRDLSAERLREVAHWFYAAMRRLEFLPNSPTLMNAGRELQQLSACFVIPVEDDMASIFQGVKDTALVQKSGGGTGFSFSRLRPSGAIVGSTGGTASGPVSFMQAYNAATEVIKQGSTRRGANMAIINVSHPDVADFIDMKLDPGAMQNFNVSVGISDHFMAAVETGAAWPLVNPQDNTVWEEVDARQLFDRIVDRAWTTGDPGMIFFDRINDQQPNGHLGDIEATNPCGEAPLAPYEACNLASVNLMQMLDAQNQLDKAKLRHTVELAVRFLDNVIDMSAYPVEAIAERTRRTRRIGLGVMGLADMLVSMGIRYDSEPALELSWNIMQTIQELARQASQDLAKERGPYPEWSAAQEWNQQHRPHLVTERPIRNTQPTTIAPTGTISVIAGVSSGIEPLFAVAYERKVMDNDRLVELNPLFEQALVEAGYDLDHPHVAHALQTGSLAGSQLPQWMREVFRVSYDISAEWHVRMQAAWQKHTDNAVSKTVNFPKEATRADVAHVFRQAWQLGCKGVTIYRDGSKQDQVLSTASSRQENIGAEPRSGEPPTSVVDEYRSRPDELRGVTHRVRTGHGTSYITVNSDATGMFEVFAAGGKSGGCEEAMNQGMTRLATLALRHGVSPERIRDQLRGIVCCPYWIRTPDGKSKLIGSPADAIAEAISREIREPVDGSDPPSTAKAEVRSRALLTLAERRQQGKPCPSSDCAGVLLHEEGCSRCDTCHWSNCS